MWVLKEDTYNYSNTLCGRIIDSLFMQTEQYSQQGESDKQKSLQKTYFVTFINNITSTLGGKQITFNLLAWIVSDTHLYCCFLLASSGASVILLILLAVLGSMQWVQEKQNRLKEKA